MKSETVKSISKLQYLCSNASDARQACLGGADWIQLRIKNADAAAWKKAAEETLKVCRDAGAKLVINDNVNLVLELSADGVHLGKDDMPLAQARAILGPNTLIGGTANTFEDILRITESGADYIGLGPYHYTDTKKNLSPVLGIEGYAPLVKQCRRAGIKLPLIAIGGIKKDALRFLLQAGVYGIAVSSAITDSADIQKETKLFLETINSFDPYGEQELSAGR
jgi:thiamine-phosphate pyrophosphorylase